MSELLTTKVRAIGTSLGVIIPRQVLNTQNVMEGEEIEITITKKNKNKMHLIKKTFGMVKNAQLPFIRDKSDRMEQYDTSR